MNTVWQTNDNVLTKVKDPVHELLTLRGVEDPEEFLRITKKKLHNPYKMKDMKPAVSRILKAIKNGEKFGIYGDYDADGVSSTSLWVLVLKELGAEVYYFIPDRFKDGYGVNKRGLDHFKNNGVSLVITCDTGITAIEQVDYCKSQGMDIIVTDHHEPQISEAYKNDVRSIGREIGSDEKYLIPDCITVNIKRPDCKYPFKGLAGVGVSFKILCAVADKLHPAKRAGAYQFMDIVSLGTFADMMDVVDENRIIGRLGLNMMNNTHNRGLYQLIRANELDGKNIVSKDIGWTIAPCINAAGRIVSAEQAVEMLISDNKLDAYRYAKELVNINKQRKELTKDYVEAIIKSIQAEQELDPTNIIVHYHPDIPEGIVGLVAGRVMNHFYKPSIILTDAEEDGVYKGSGRSVSAFDLFHALMPHTDILEGFGGHQAACGMSITSKNFKEFKTRLEMYADATLSEADLQPKIYIDCIVKGDLLDIEFVEDLNRLEPYGNGNQKPTFMMQKMKIIKVKPVGEAQNHFWALLSDGKKTFATIGWFLWEKYEAIGKPKVLDVAFFPQINEWPKESGKFSVQLEIQDFRKHEGRK